jgi:hypothetical protein
MKKWILTTLAVALTAGSVLMIAPEAKADDGRIAAGVAGGLIGGALLGGALAGAPVYAAPPPPPVYYEPAPVYVEEPECRWVRQQYWDGYGYRIRRAQVCD